MNSHPLVSVCIPAFNSESFIGLTLESVLSQTCEDFEIVVCDDKSSDGTVSAIQRFNDPRIRLIPNERNLGMGGNWNKVVSLAKGKYVKLLCGDDVIYPDCLARQAERLEADSQLVLAVCGSEVIDRLSRVIFRRRSHFRPGRATGNELIPSCIRWGTNLIGEPAVGLFRREVLARSVSFRSDNPYLIDLAFWADLLKHGDAFIEDERMAAFRVSAHSVSTRVGLKQAASFRRFVLEIHRDRAYRTSPLDVTLGCMLSVQWCLLRNLVIKLRAQ
jgi:glycosyltransferase involved in cell wall biosynthesis